MMIKDYFADGLLQIAVVLSLLRSDFDSFLYSSVRSLPVRSHLLETNIGPLSGITRADLNFHSRLFVREFPKVLDNYNDRFSSVLRDLHSLSDYRRFDGISTNFHAWLVNDGSSENSTSSCEHSAEETSDEGTATNEYHVGSIPAAAEVSAVASEPNDTNDLNLFVEGELSKEDMELINILYLQDIDLGIGREAFEDLCSDSSVSSVEQKSLKVNQSLVSEADDGFGFDSTTTTSSSGSGSVTVSSQQSVSNADTTATSLQLSPQYIIDTETGELVLASSSHNVHYAQQSSAQSDDPDTTTTTTAGSDMLIDSSTDYSHTDIPQQQQQQTLYIDERESSYEETWQDMLSILDLQSVLEGDNVSCVCTDCHCECDNTSSASLALMHNVSMTPSYQQQQQQPVESCAVVTHSTDSVPDSAAASVCYELPALSHNNSLSLFNTSLTADLDVNVTCQPSQLISHTNSFNESSSSLSSSRRRRRLSVEDVSVMSSRLHSDTVWSEHSDTVWSDESSCSRTLSTTVEHYSSASAALNHDELTPQRSAANTSYPPPPPPSAYSSSNVTDTNALFHQLLCSNLLLDELNLDNYTFLNHNLSMCDDWSSADSAVSSMHSPTITEGGSDVPSGASGFTDDLLSTQSVISSTAAAAGITSHSGVSKYSSCSREVDRVFDDNLPRVAGLRPAANSVSGSNSSSCGDCWSKNSSSSADDQWSTQHNHTYSLREAGPPSSSSRSGRHGRSEDDEDGNTEQRDSDDAARRSRDQKKANDMQIPLTMEEMIDSSVEHFNELLSKHRLSDAQNQLIRDIRRRGKNKQAAQNCRKRKLEVIQTVEDELMELRRERDKLLQDKLSLDKRSVSLKHKFSVLEAQLFQRLQNETGQQYDPQMYSVLHTDDGRVFIVPRDTHQQQHDEQKKRHRKPDHKDT